MDAERLRPVPLIGRRHIVHPTQWKGRLIAGSAYGLTAGVDFGLAFCPERLAEGHDIPDEERGLMERALAENAVIVAQMEPLFGDEEDDSDD